MELELPLFPSYLFVLAGTMQKSELLSIPGLLQIVGGGQSSNALSQNYIDMLRTGVELGAFTPHSMAQEGDRVRVISGAFQGVEGTLLRTSTQARILISIELIQRCISLEVSWSEIELIDRPLVRPRRNPECEGCR